MKILYLTPSVPYPPDQGVKLRALALIRAAAAHHQVDVLAFGSEDEPGVAELRRVCRDVRVAPYPERRGVVRRSWDLLIDQLPDLAHRLESGAYATELQAMLEGQRYDVVQLEGLEMMPYLSMARALGDRAAIVYDAQNAEMYLQRTMWQAEIRDPRRWHAALYSMVQWSKLGSYERIMMNETGMVIAVSEIDAGKLRGRRVDPQLVPNGVDTAAIPYREPPERPPKVLLFAGALDYRPNADAVRWLTRRILPLVRARVPSARLRLVGTGSDTMRAEGVDALGHVPDVGAELARAGVAVVPMRMGSGTRFKALEAMAAGVPVVSTTLGIAGIAAEHERHALIADSPATFAASVVRLLEEPALGRRLAQQARRLVENRYDWGRITPIYLRLLAQARRARRQAGA